MVKGNQESAIKDGTEIPGSHKELGTRLRLVVSRFKNRAEAARAAGVSATSLQRWLDGMADPAFSSVALLARACGVSLDWLATGRGEMMGPPINDVGPDGQAGAVDWELLWMISRQLELFRQERRLNWSDERKFDLVKLGYEMMIKKRESGKEPEVEDFHYILRAAS